MKSNNSKIQVGQLLRDTFSYTAPIYLSMLVFALPDIIVSFLSLGMTLGANVLIYVIYFFGIFPFMSGAAIFYVHQNLTHRGATIPNSLQASGERFTQLVLLTFMVFVFIFAGLLFLVIPGIYLSIRLSFAPYALMIERRSAFDSLSRSWQLTAGQWWKLFWAILILGLIILTPVLIAFILSAAVDPGGTDLASALASFLISPLSYVYYVFLFMSFVNLASEDVSEG